MATITKAELKSFFTGWQNLDNRLSKSILTASTSMSEIQKDVANNLSTVKKRTAFCLFMEYQKKIDGKVTQRLQTCIGKPTTQRYYFKIASDKPLTQKMSIRTASKELLKYKLKGKAIVDQKQIDKKGVYHTFKWDIPAVKKPTQISASQKVVNDFTMTKVQYIANAEKITFATVE